MEIGPCNAPFTLWRFVLFDCLSMQICCAGSVFFVYCCSLNSSTVYKFLWFCQRYVSINYWWTAIVVLSYIWWNSVWHVTVKSQNCSLFVDVTRCLVRENAVHLSAYLTLHYLGRKNYDTQTAPKHNLKCCVHHSVSIHQATLHLLSDCFVMLLSLWSWQHRYVLSVEYFTWPCHHRYRIKET